jgi:hypothetical protein
VASAVAHGKMLKAFGPDISAATAPFDQKHLQILKMFAANFPFACVVVSTRHSVISSDPSDSGAFLERNIFRF